MKIGILALQGAVREHRNVLKKLGVNTVDVLYPEDLKGLDGLILPGGESTTVGKLLVRYNLLKPIQDLCNNDFPIFGTCTGLILLAKDIKGSDQYRIGVMDIEVERNAFGRQMASFEADLSIDILGEKPYHAVFIRAPYIEKVKDNVEVLYQLDNKILMARQGNILVAAFHPELTDDFRVHELFINMCSK